MSVSGAEYMTDQPQQTSGNAPRLFGSSGVRGIVGEDLTEELCHQVGRAVGTMLSPQSRVCIATDSRVSREVVGDAVTTGLCSTGASVTHMGMLPTPALAFLTRSMGFDTGVMITASHNPPQFNGIKLFNSDCIGYGRTQEEAIERLCARGEFRNDSCGELTHAPHSREEYLRCMEERFPVGTFGQGFRVVVDPANGAAAGLASELFTRLGLDVIPINDEPDGHFPNRDPEPRKDTLAGTAALVRERDADLAVCFDGDADRVVFLDRMGFVGFDEAIAFAARLAVTRSGKRRVAATMETGGLIDLALNDLRAKVVRGRVGDVYVAHLVRELDAAIGVEPAGVYIMPEIGFYPDSMFAALTMLSQIHRPEDIRESLSHLPRLYWRQDRVPCPNGAKTPVIEAVRARASQLKPRAVNDLDGLRLEFGGSWLLIRASGTEPLIRVNAESASAEETEALLGQGVEIVRSTVARLAA